MSYRVEVAPRAAREIRKLPRHTHTQVTAKINVLADDPRPHGVEMLSAVPGVFKMRSGHYRILYRIDDEALVVLVVKVADRREVYRRLSDL